MRAYPPVWKQIVVAAIATLISLMAVSVIGVKAAEAPKPRYVTIPATSNGMTIYLGVRGKQSTRLYSSKYVTVVSSQNCVVFFDKQDDIDGYHDGVTSSSWGGASYDAHVQRGAYIFANEKMTFRVSATTMEVDGLASSGTMTVVVEYEE